MDSGKDVSDVHGSSTPANNKLIGLIIILMMIAVAGISFYGYKNVCLKTESVLLMDELKRVSTKANLDEGQLQLLQKWQKKVLLGVPGSSKVYSYILHYYKRTPPTVARQIANTIVETSDKYKVGIGLITAIIEQESAFNPYALSKKNARGLMQVRHSVWGTELELENQYQLHEITTGIESGVKVIKIYLKETKGDISEALYLYVGKDKKYVREVLTRIGKFEVFYKGVVDAENTEIH